MFERLNLFAVIWFFGCFPPLLALVRTQTVKRSNVQTAAFLGRTMTDTIPDFILRPRVARRWSVSADQSEIARERAMQKRAQARAAAKYEEATEKN